MSVTERLERSLDAHGGLAPIHAAGGITLEARGRFNLASRFQGHSPFRSEETPICEWISVDLQNDTTYFRLQWRNYAHSQQDLVEVYRGEGHVFFGDRVNGFAGWDPSWLVDDQAARYRRFVPQLLLQELLSNPQAVSGGREGRIVYATPAMDMLTVEIDRETHLLQFVETEIDMPLFGRQVVRWQWSAYEGGYPGQLDMYLGDRLLKTEFLSYALGLGDIESIYGAIDEPPEGAEPERGPPPGGSPHDIRPIDDGIHGIANLRPGIHGMVVEFDEFAVLIDAPSTWYEMQMMPPLNWSQGETSISLGTRYLDASRAATGGKPVRFVVLTHHHTDHIGSIRALLHDDLTVVGTRESLEAVDIALEADLALTGADWPVPDFQRVTVEGEFEISDGNRTLRLIELPDENPQAGGYLAVHLPAENILYFSAFIYPMPEPVFPLAESVNASKWLVRWLDEHGLAAARQYNVHGLMEVEPWQIDRLREL